MFEIASDLIFLATSTPTMRSVSTLLLCLLLGQADSLQVGSSRVTTRRNLLAALPLVAAAAPALAAGAPPADIPTGMQLPQQVIARALAGDTVKASEDRAAADKAAKRQAELDADTRKVHTAPTHTHT